MGAGVVIDTSYLITLADPKRKHHKVARRYWRHFLEQSITIYLPTIVVSEFYLMQELPQDILRACIILPFNWPDAVRSAALDFRKLEKGKQTSRDALKDDMKIIAQAVVIDAAWIVTDDTSSMYKFVKKLQQHGQPQLQPIALEHGFDASNLDASRQYPMFDIVEPSPDDDI